MQISIYYLNCDVFFSLPPTTIIQAFTVMYNA